MSTTALIIRPGTRPYTTQVTPTAEALREFVGGPLVVVARRGWHAYVHEDGKVLGLPVNPVATSLLFPEGGDVVTGTAVVVGTGPAGTEADVPARVVAGVLAAGAATGLVVQDPGDLLAAVSVLLGDVPDRTLTVLGLAHGRLDAAMMIRLPSDLDVPLVVVRRLVRTPGTAVELLVVGGHRVGVEEPPPYADLVAAVTPAVDRARAGVVHATWTSRLEPGAGWYCYAEPTCTGRIPAPPLPQSPVPQWPVPPWPVPPVARGCPGRPRCCGRRWWGPRQRGPAWRLRARPRLPTPTG